MKTTLKIIQYRDGTWGAKKKGWFGWTYLDDIYDGNWSSHYGWSYSPPSASDAKFGSKKEVVEALVKYYHGKIS